MRSYSSLQARSTTPSALRVAALHLGRDLVSARSPGAVARRACDRTAQCCGALAAVLGLARDDGHLDVAYARGFERKLLRNAVNAAVDFWDPVREVVARWADVTVWTAAELRPRHPHVARFLDENRAEAVAVVPLPGVAAPAGALVLLFGTFRRLTRAERDYLLAAGQLAGLAMERAQARDAERLRTRQLTAAIAEVHHRVKNSLQWAVGLLEMQVRSEAREVPIEAVATTLSQIRTIAMVHDLLSRDEPGGTVNSDEMLRKLVVLLSEGLTPEHDLPSIRLETEPLILPTEVAVSIALVANELVNNAHKHGRNPGALGADAITIVLRRTPDGIVLAVSDSGPGFPADFDARPRSSIGLELVRSLIRTDLHGRLRIEANPGGGALVTVTMPAAIARRRAAS